MLEPCSVEDFNDGDEPAMGSFKKQEVDPYDMNFWSEKDSANQFLDLPLMMFHCSLSLFVNFHGVA